jgi:nucleotide-binding universal stress UspA family protein
MVSSNLVVGLVAADGDGERVVAATRRLAELARRPALVVHVCELALPSVPAGIAPGPPLHPDGAPAVAPPAQPEVAELERAAVARAHELLDGLGVGPDERRAQVGDPAVVLPALLADVSAALAVVATRGLGPVHGGVLGSVSRMLAREAPCPVVVLPPRARAPFAGGPLVCGVGRADPEDDAVPEAAGALAALLGRRLVLAHVLQVVSTAAVATPHAAASLAVERPPSPEARAQGLALLRAARTIAGARPDSALELREGDPARELRAAADEAEADALVVGTRGHGAVRSALLGSVALELCRFAERPVVVVPPRRAYGSTRPGGWRSR